MSKKLIVHERFQFGAYQFGPGEYEHFFPEAGAFAKEKGVGEVVEVSDENEVPTVSETTPVDSAVNASSLSVVNPELAAQDKPDLPLTLVKPVTDTTENSENPNTPEKVRARIKALTGRIPDTFPGATSLAEAGIFQFEQIPTSREALLQIKGIGEKTIIAMEVALIQLCTVQPVS